MPSIDWYFNGKLILPNKSSEHHEPYHVVRYREHYFISKELVIGNLSAASSGHYVCMLNKNKPLKSISLVVKNDQSKNNGRKRVIISTIVPIVVIIFVSFAAMAAYFRL